MFIDNKAYNTPAIYSLSDLRIALFKYCYSNPVQIERLKEKILSEIDCLGLEYDPSTYTFTIKIKKTSMRRHYKFVNQPQFYYSIITNVFARFISENYDMLVANTGDIFDDPSAALHQLGQISGEGLSMLAHISCISDNIVLIKL